MPDHLHALVSFSAEEQMAEVIRDWKRFITRKTSVKWQAGFFDHRLRNAAAFDEKAAYIRLNPLRAELVSALTDWPFIWNPSADDTQPAR